MISIPLFKNGIKNGWKLLLILGAVVSMYFSIIVTMFDPTLGAALDEFIKAMPQLMSMFGMHTMAANLVDFIASYLYGMIMLVFPMLFSILTANRLVARQIDQGTMAYLLAAPVSRKKVVFTQALVLILGVFALLCLATGVGVLTSHLSFPGKLNLQDFLLLNVGALALHLFIAGFCFLSSCFFNDTKYSTGVATAVPVFSYVLQMIANAGDKFKNVRYATFFTLFDPTGIINRTSSALWGIVVLFIGAAFFFGIAFFVFTKKDIPV